MKRAVKHFEDPSDPSRVRGAEVLWQGEITDIVSGTIPLNVELPALASKEHHRSRDEWLRVRLGSGVGRSVLVDIWFDVEEEVVRDDY